MARLCTQEFRHIAPDDIILKQILARFPDSASPNSTDPPQSQCLPGFAARHPITRRGDGICALDPQNARGNAWLAGIARTGAARWCAGGPVRQAFGRILRYNVRLLKILALFAPFHVDSRYVGNDNSRLDARRGTQAANGGRL